MSHQDTVGNLEFLTTEYLGEKKSDRGVAEPIP